MTNTKPIDTDPARHLRCVKAYWLQTVQPYIQGRRLQGPELYVAVDAHRRLLAAVERARKWNRSDSGLKSPVPPEIITEVQTDVFREPEPLFLDENLKPETLAQIASPLLKGGKLAMGDAIRRAHEILMEAERYVATLPTRREGAESLIEDFDQAFSTISFAEILLSSDEKSGQVPLLRGVATKRAALSAAALKMAVRRYLGEGSDCLKNKQIPLQRLCDLRWQRFKTFWESQSARRRTKVGKPRKRKNSKG
jgi:hypothetical protein